MKTLDTAEDKIQKICDTLRHKTLEPAQEEAKRIVAEAQERAEQIVHHAEKQVEQLLAEARKNIERERNVFQSSLSQAGKQSLEALRQAIEHKLFNNEIQELIGQQATNPNVVAKLISAVVAGLEKDGLDADLAVYIPASVSVKEVNQLLGERILNKLKDKSVVLGDFGGGVKVRLEGKRMTLDVSNTVLEDLMSQYVRKDFRKLLFAKP